MNFFFEFCRTKEEHCQCFELRWLIAIARIINRTKQMQYDRKECVFPQVETNRSLHFHLDLALYCALHRNVGFVLIFFFFSSLIESHFFFFLSFSEHTRQTHSHTHTWYICTSHFHIRIGSVRAVINNNNNKRKWNNTLYSGSTRRESVRACVFLFTWIAH